MWQTVQTGRRSEYKDFFLLKIAEWPGEIGFGEFKRCHRPKVHRP